MEDLTIYSGFLPSGYHCLSCKAVALLLLELFVLLLGLGLGGLSHVLWYTAVCPFKRDDHLVFLIVNAPCYCLPLYLCLFANMNLFCNKAYQN